MNELVLFAGAGGGILGAELLGHRIVCAVENDPFCCEVLARRQEDGSLEAFPIWAGDIADFDGKPWRGKVDVISAGFPCQPFSSASRGRANATDLWDEAVRVIEEVGPRSILLENVERKAFPRDTWPFLDFIPASALGAPHERGRYWLLAHADSKSEQPGALHEEVASLREAPHPEWWKNAPGDLLGAPDELASELDRARRLRALGNGQVPVCVVAAWEELSRG